MVRSPSGKFVAHKLDEAVATKVAAPRRRTQISVAGAAWLDVEPRRNSMAAPVNGNFWFGSENP